MSSNNDSGPKIDPLTKAGALRVIRRLHDLIDSGRVGAMAAHDLEIRVAAETLAIKLMDALASLGLVATRNKLCAHPGHRSICILEVGHDPHPHVFGVEGG